VITAADLNKFLGKNITAICTNGYTKPEDNHCAHFVSHALDYGFGYTCRAAVNGKGPAANLRVHEVFARCPAVGRWDDKPADLKTCLAFVTAKSNVQVANKMIANVPKKHIGIFIDGTIWHYSNANHKVMTQNPEDFSHHYAGADIELFYGQMIP
jgi:hypothetical protein